MKTSALGIVTRKHPRDIQPRRGLFEGANRGLMPVITHEVEF